MQIALRARAPRRLCLAAALALCAALVPAGSLAAVPQTHPGALSPSDVARLSASPTQRVIVLLRDQHREVPGRSTGGERSRRAAAIVSDQSRIARELAALR